MSGNAIAPFQGKFSPAELEKSRDHLLKGMAEQDLAFLEICAAQGVDPRASARVVPTRAGEFIATAADEQCLFALMSAVRVAPKKVEITFEKRPVFVSLGLPPGSQSTEREDVTQKEP